MEAVSVVNLLVSQSLHSQHREGAGAVAASGASSGRDALIVFLGTLTLGAVGLLVAIAIAPDRFGMARRTAVESPSESARASATALAADAAPGEGLRESASRAEPSRTPEEASAHRSIARRTEAQARSDAGAGPGRIQEPGPMQDLGRIAESVRSWESRVPTEILAPRPAVVGAPGERRPTVVRTPAPDPVGKLIFEDALSTVVHVTTLATRAENVPMNESVAGTGSGLVWDRHGHIVTSRHVIAGVKGANVLFSDGRGLSAKLIATDEATDIAVLRVDAPAGTLTPIRVGTSYDLRVGMRAFSVACPYGLRHSLASGLISGLDRTIRLTTALQLGGVVQTDTSVQPGCSGGALIDDQGRVIGMNAAIHWDSQREPGVGFALPIDLLQNVVPRLIRDGLRWHFEFGFVTATAAQSEDFLERVGARYTSTALPGGASSGTPLARVQRPYLPESGLVVMGVDSGTA
ncbi:MAG: trypsin-like peptidase domain-containing protein, partial [Planctomycetota bacterium]